jgi:hypothetical protein
MSKQTINIGASPNDGTGTPLRTSFDYTNQNFTEIYTALGGGVALPGATTQVIFNDGGTNLAGDAGLVYNKTTDALTVAGLVTAGSATITGDLTVDTSTLKVDSTNNRVGIGTAAPYTTAESLSARTTALTSIAAFATMPLTVTDSTAFAAGVGGGINFRAKLSASLYSDYAAIWSQREVATSNDYKGSLVFGTSDNSNGYPIERFSIASTGNVSIATGNVVMATSGKGIDFSATTSGSGTMTSELLNDYEEGTWTIGLKFGGASVGLTTSANTGRYTKVGRQVNVTGYIQLTNKGTSVGAAAITGLPFGVANNAESYAPTTLRLNGVSYTGAVQAYAANTSPTISLEQLSILGAITDITDSNFTNASAVMFNVTYTVA